MVMSTEERRHEGRYYMEEIEREIGRHRSTIRTWESRGWLPDGLAFNRDENGWRYWTDEQLVQVKQWMATRNPGRTQARRSAA